MIDEAYKMVEAFQKVAKQPISKFPVELSKKRVIIRANWMIEEIKEFIAAKDIYSQADALTDLLYYLLGTYVEMGVKPDTLFNIVHDANMMKLTTTEGVKKREDGKVQKPSNWKHPDAAIKEAIDKIR